ncbi:DEKNAAC100210 [Brettanomyces naardenensis]|uniref:Derlin n=1 Tax=Brettanomyces naardenensis TaxID=13370 RepID=A0A448YF52_BRENA|nr:DEKNAAC100210 [Brettanomyces naardenensis]
MERIPVDWLMEIPPVTRTYLIGVVGVSLLEYTGFLGRGDCYYSPDVVFKKGQYYRLLSSFLYFGTFSFDLLFTLYVVTRYSKALEQSYAKTRDYVWCLFVICTLILLYSSIVGNLYMLGSYLNDTLLYIWSRRNPDVEMTILGLVNFRSVYLPLVSVLLSRLVTSNFKVDWKSELAGVLIGQFFIFFNDMFPKLHSCESPLRPIWYWFKDDHERIEQVPEVAAAPEVQQQQQQQQGQQQINDVNDLDAQPVEPEADGLRQRRAFL